MKEVYEALKALGERKERGALVTVVRTRGSAPRRAGAKMLVLAGGEIIGTVGGGCVEAEVSQEAQDVLKTGEPKLLSFSLTADLAADTGMICGGTMDMFIEPESDFAGEILEALTRNEAVALANVTKSSDGAQAQPGMKLLVKEDGTVSGALAGSPLERPMVEDCLAAIRAGDEENRIARYPVEGAVGPEAAVEAYIEVIRRRPTAIIVGAGHIGVHLTRIARAAGFDVTIIDDRPDFADAERLPDANRVVAADIAESLANLEIDANSYVVLVTRGHKHDEIALREVVGSSAAYIGMIGSRTRVRTVRERLIRDGFPRERLDSIYAPIGLDIGAETPEEIAVSIVAEMVKVRRGGEAQSLRSRTTRPRHEGALVVVKGGGNPPPALPCDCPDADSPSS